MKIGDTIVHRSNRNSNRTFTIVGFTSVGDVVYEFKVGIQIFIETVHPDKIEVVIPKKKGWINIYSRGHAVAAGKIYPTKEEAMAGRCDSTPYTDCIEIEYKAE